ncbi:hypothetical protein STSP2_01868 [Anaerohalosphaera lusitana]|uniref:Uncharacterized protein n=1 Tax=Anaerohalosphaera lusitana TaxID=1936003 RepID=A0A1U9NMG2_9BACT|nr:hypothetical protein [Anaerohalosphaera lusitana]AQT68696.1 hypothetical protein STSP2_01868 [Anaerohalosphaera lusitana]
MGTTNTPTHPAGPVRDTATRFIDTTRISLSKELLAIMAHPEKLVAFLAFSPKLHILLAVPGAAEETREYLSNNSGGSLHVDHKVFGKTVSVSSNARINLPSYIWDHISCVSGDCVRLFVREKGIEIYPEAEGDKLLYG